MNISTTRIILDKSPIRVVIPRLRPTVPSADAVSNRQLRSGRVSTLLMISPPAKNSAKYIIIRATAFRTVSSLTRRPKHVTCSRLWKIDRAVSSRMAPVVVFIPPAVDPGDPPISIHRIISAWLSPLTPFSSIVLNPAVRSVTDWNRDGRIRLSIGSCSISVSKNQTKGIRIIAPDAARAILLCSRYCFRRKRCSFTSFHTRKPIPPMVISSTSTTFTITFCA